MASEVCIGECKLHRSRPRGNDSLVALLRAAPKSIRNRNEGIKTKPDRSGEEKRETPGDAFLASEVCIGASVSLDNCGAPWSCGTIVRKHEIWGSFSGRQVGDLGLSERQDLCNKGGLCVTVC